MMFRNVFLLGLMLIGITSFAQDEVKRNLYYGNEAFTEGDYEKAASYYLDAVDQSPLNFKANYNLSNAYFRMSQYDKAMERMNTVINLAPTSFDKSKAYHNIGNACMMKQDLKGAIEAYENGLRLNPSDEETRYNLAYALMQKQKQDQQKKDQNNENSGDGQNMGDNQDENSDQNEDQNGDQNEDQNQNDQQDDPNDGNNGDQQNEQRPDQQPPQEENGNSQGYTSKLSKEQIQHLLDAYYRREKETQKKVTERVGFGSPRKKDW